MNASILTYITWTKMLYEKQNYSEGLKNVEYINSGLEYIINDIVKCGDNEKDMKSVSKLLCALKDLIQAQQDNDFNKLVYLYGYSIINILAEIQFRHNLEVNQRDSYVYDENMVMLKIYNTPDRIILEEKLNKWELNMENYFVEYTSSGLLTLKIIDEGRERYIHSNNNPCEEGMLFAEENYEDSKESYIIVGMGFAYHILGLLQKNVDITINIYESDINIIKMAFQFVKLGYLLKLKNVHIHYDKEYNKLFKVLETADMNRNKLMVHSPSLQLGDGGINIKKILAKNSKNQEYLE